MRTQGRRAREAAITIAIERPELGSVRAARELKARGVHLSPSGVRAIWQKHGLATRYERLLRRKREAKGGRLCLSDPQRALLDRMRVSRRIVVDAGATNDSAASVRRDRLISAAIRVLDRKGYEGASLREICAAAGILPGSLYYHFKSKEDLFIQVHAAAFKQLNEAVSRALAAESDPWRRLEAACAAHLELLVAREDVSLVKGTSLFHTAPPALQRRLNRDRNAYEERFRRLIDALDLPPDVDRSLLRLALLGALNWTRMWYRPGRKTSAEIARHLVQTILRRALDASKSGTVSHTKLSASKSAPLAAT